MQTRDIKTLLVITVLMVFLVLSPISAISEKPSEHHSDVVLDVLSGDDVIVRIVKSAMH